MEYEGFEDEDWDAPENEKQRAQQAELRDNLDSAMDLLEVSDRPKKNVTFAIDSYNPRTREEFELFRNRLASMIERFRSSSQYLGFVTGLVTRVAGSLDSEEIKKVLGGLQILLNSKIEEKRKPAARQAPKRPTLKHGGSTKSSFEHNLGRYDEDYDEDDNQY